MRSKTRVIKRAITAAFLGLALMLSALSATAQTYSFESETGTFTSIRDTGNEVTLADGSTDLGTFGSIPVPFEFHLFGQRVTGVVPTTAAWLTTNLGYRCSAVNPCLNPTSDNAGAVGFTDSALDNSGGIFPFWYNTPFYSSGTSGVFYETSGEVGSRTLTIEWSRFIGNIDIGVPAFSAQVRLYEENSEIDFIYENLDASIFSSAAIGLSASRTFIPDSTSARYYTLNNASSTAQASTGFRDFDPAIPETGQTYSFTPEFYLPPPADISTFPSANISRVLPQAVYGKGTVTYALTDLPVMAGFSIGFDADSRTLSGTSTVAIPEATLTYTATDDLGDSDEATNATASQTFTLTVATGTDSITAFASDAAISPNPISVQANSLIGQIPLPEPTVGDEPYSYSFTPQLPTGLYFNPRNLVLEGAPTTPQSATTYIYTATDIDGDTDTLMFMITVEVDPDAAQAFTFIPCQVLSETTETLMPLGTGTPTYAISTSSPLPQWLNIETVDSASSNFLRLLGTVPCTGVDTTATTTYTYTATDSDNNEVSADFIITIRDDQPSFSGVDPIPTVVAIEDVALDPLDPSITLPASTTTTVDTTYNDDLTYSIMENLPAGLTFNAGMRRLSGTPTEVPDPATAMFTYIATDEDGDTAMLMFEITVMANIPLAVPPPSRELYTLVTGAGVQELLLSFPRDDAVGGNPSVTRVISRTMPDFTTLSDPNDSSFEPDSLNTTWLTIFQGTIRGVAPTDVGNKDESVPRFSVIGTYTDAVGKTATHTFNFQVIDVMPIAPETAINDADFVFNQGELITPKTLPRFTTNVDDLPLLANGMREIPIPDFSYILTDMPGDLDQPSLPPGLSFNRTTRVLTGTPTVVGDHTVTYRADDRSQRDRDWASETFTITVLPDVPSFVGSPIDELILTQNTPITNVTLPMAIGKDMPLDYSISPALPMGLSFNATSRVLSGTPRVTLPRTPFTYTVADDDTPAQTATLMFHITVFVDLMPTFASDAEIEPITAIVDQDITSVVLPKVVENSNGESIGTGVITYSIMPPLPQGLEFDDVSGSANFRRLSGAPTEVSPTTTYTYTATDSDTVEPDTAMLTFTITVEADPELTPPANPAFVLVPGQTLNATSTPSGTLPPFTGNNGMLTYTLSNEQGLMDAFDFSFDADDANGPLISGDIAPDVIGVDNSVVSMTFRYTATDDDDTADEADDDTGFVDITIEVVDALPVAPTNLPTPSFSRDSTTTFRLPAFTTTVDDRDDVTAPTLRYSLKTGHPTWLSIPDDEDPVLSAEPTSSEALGDLDVTYIATDGADEAEATFTLTVTDDPAPIPPVDFDGAFTFRVGQVLPAPMDEEAEVLPVFTISYDEDGSSLMHSLTDDMGNALDPADTLIGGLMYDSTTRTIHGEVMGTPNNDDTANVTYTYSAIETEDRGVEGLDPGSTTFTITIEDDVPSFSNATPIGTVRAIAGVPLDSDIELPDAEFSRDDALPTYGDNIMYTIEQSMRAGLTFNSNTNPRTLSGTPALPAGTFPITYTATDEDGDFAEFTFTITVEENTRPAAPSINNLVYEVGQNVLTPSETLPVGTGGNAPLTYSLTDSNGNVIDSSSNLPAGLVYNPADRTITGNIAADMANVDGTALDSSAVAMTYTYTATDNNGDEDFATFTISVVDVIPVAPSPAIEDFNVTTNAAIQAGSSLPPFGNNIPSGSMIEPNFTYTLTGGWLTIDNDRVLSGTAPDIDTNPGDAVTTFTYTATDANGVDSASVSFDVTAVADSSPTLPAIPNGGYTFAVGVDPMQNLPIASGGDGVLMYSLFLSSDTGMTNSLTMLAVPPNPLSAFTFDPDPDSGPPTISGTLEGTAADDSVSAVEYTYIATDEDDDVSDPVVFTIAIVDEMPAFATGHTIDPISGTQGTAIGTIPALPAVESIGSGGITYIFDPMLPAGLTFNQSTRVISGTPSAGLPETTFTYRARDADGDTTPPLTFTITIEATGDPVVMPLAAPTIPNGGYTFAVGQTLANPIVLPVFTGGNRALTYSLAVSSAPETSVTTLVGGLMFAPNSREITGPVDDDTPANDNAAETYTYTATDGSATATVNFTITITDADGLVPPAEPQALRLKPGDDVNVTLDPHTGGSGSITYTATPETVQAVMEDFGLEFIPSTRIIMGDIDSDAGNIAEVTYTYTATSGTEMHMHSFTIVVTDVPSLDMATASAIPTVGANIALVASQAISSRVELALDGLSSGIDIRTLDGPSLRLNPQQQSGGSGSPVRFGVWYSAASDSLSDTRGEVTWSGDTDSTNLGFDVGFDISADISLVVGILQNSSSTTATYRNTEGGDAGNLSVDLDSTAFYVGLGYDWLDAWFANGSADSTLNDSQIETGIPASFSYQTIGLTASFEIIDSLSVGGKVESLTSDLSLTEMSDMNFSGLQTDSSQLRTAFVANYQLKLGEKGNGLLIPKFEFGFRDLSLGTNTMETDVAAVGGSAMESGFGIDYIQRAWGLTVGLDIRSISVENYTSDSTQYQIRWESGSYGNGLSFQLTPHSVSETLGGIDSLYSGGYNQYQSVLERQRGGSSTQDSKGMDFEVGYGFVASYGTVTPYLKTTNYRGSGSQAEEFGIRYQTLSGLELTLTAERSLTPQTIQILGFPLTFMQQENALTFNTRYSF